MISDIFAKLTDVVVEFGSTVGSIFRSAIDLIYDGESLTEVGILMLLGLGSGLLIWGFKFIRKLIRVRTK